MHAAVSVCLFLGLYTDATPIICMRTKKNILSSSLRILCFAHKRPIRHLPKKIFSFFFVFFWWSAHVWSFDAGVGRTFRPA